MLTHTTSLPWTWAGGRLSDFLKNRDRAISIYYISFEIYVNNDSFRYRSWVPVVKAFTSLATNMSAFLCLTECKLPSQGLRLPTFVSILIGLSLYVRSSARDDFIFFLIDLLIWTNSNRRRKLAIDLYKTSGECRPLAFDRFFISIKGVAAISRLTCTRCSCYIWRMRSNWAFW